LTFFISLNNFFLFIFQHITTKDNISFTSDYLRCFPLFGENFDSDMQKIFLKKLTSALEKKNDNQIADGVRLVNVQKREEMRRRHSVRKQSYLSFGILDWGPDLFHFVSLLRTL